MNKDQRDEFDYLLNEDPEEQRKADREERKQLAQELMEANS